MLDSKKYNRNRIVIFVLFTLVTLVIGAFLARDYMSLSLEAIDFNSYYAKDVADKVVNILEGEQRVDRCLGFYFVAQWIVGLILFIRTKSKN